MPNNFSYLRVTTGAILDGTIINADVDASAAIASSKLNLGAVAQNIIPDADIAINLGSGAKKFLSMYVKYGSIESYSASILPANDNSIDLGSSSKKIKDAYINELFGNCIGQIVMLSLLGG